MKLAILALLLVGQLVAAQEWCPNTRPQGYFSFDTGSPVYVPSSNNLPTGYVTSPPGFSICDLYQLQNYCVMKINEYRVNLYPFSDGRYSNHNLGIGNLTLLDSPFLQCHNEKALSDLMKDNSGAGCGHYTAGANCGFGGTAGTENSCCKRSCSTLAQCKSVLDGCLKQMWDEGILVLNGQTTWTTSNGHYMNMISTNKYVTCGFGWDTQNRVYMTQNYWGSFAGCRYSCQNTSSTCGTCYNSLAAGTGSAGVPPAMSASATGAANPPLPSASASAAARSATAGTPPLPTGTAGTPPGPSASASGSVAARSATAGTPPLPTGTAGTPPGPSGSAGTPPLPSGSGGVLPPPLTGSGANQPVPPCTAPRLCTPLPRVCANDERVMSGPAPACCATCMPPTGRDETSCPAAKIEACQSTYASLPPCLRDQQPVRNLTSCCLTCRVVAEVVNTCQTVDCSKIVNTIPYCAPGQSPQFNSSSCCPTCRPAPAPALPTPPPTGGRCTSQQVSQCMANTTACAIGEFPFMLPNSCCPSCRRPQSLCSPDIVVLCRATSRNCTQGEVPVVPQGECCLNCKPQPVVPPRTCTPACAAGSRCSVVRRAGSFSFVCRRRAVVSLTLKATDATRAAQLDKFNPDQFRDLLREFMERWCEDNVDSALCKLLKAADDVDAQVVGVTKQADGSITLKIDTSSDPVAATDVSNHYTLFADSDSWATGISASASSTYAAGDLSVSSVSTSTDTPSSASVAGHFAMLVAVGVAIVASFF